jgi:hypothetical protein
VRHLHKHIKRHRKKYLYCTSIVAAVIASGMLSQVIFGVPNISFYFTAGDTDDTGSYFTAVMNLRSNVPVNAIQGEMVYSSGVELIDVSVKDSIVDLWVAKPASSTDTGKIIFSGGIIKKGGFTGDGEIFRARFHSKEKVTSIFNVANPVVAKSDGKGTLVTPSIRPLNYIVGSTTLITSEEEESRGLWDGFLNFFRNWGTQN